MDLFEENKQKATSLQNQITQTDKEIDQMVYELYGLTEEEIAVNVLQKLRCISVFL